MAKTYIYLLKRSKKDIKIIGSVQSNIRVIATRLKDLNLLGLPAQKRLDLQAIVVSHQLDWEVWIESAEDYEELMKSLHNRGFIVPPSSNTPLMSLMSHEIPKSSLVKLNKNKTMIRKN